MFVIDKNLMPTPEVKADPMSLDGFIAWLEKQDAAERYDWENCSGRCLVGQYQCHCLGVDAANRPSGYGAFFGYKLTNIFQRIALEHPWTFGGALTRARAYRDGSRP